MSPCGRWKRWRPNVQPRRGLEWTEEEAAPTWTPQETQGGPRRLRKVAWTTVIEARALEGAGGCCAPPDPRGNAAGSCVETDVLRWLPDRSEAQRGIVAGALGAGDWRERSRA
ncbi:hypothetical protein NDU88_006447 [Pleurodeles waltl]|uniref:Uncharacterized protein n=1 Tax=Pleurodeles waltl TaxID=8319 RepID=A0AAV7TDM0_PLEWA|nr:hypothetical protein NDU88_006447 [Pleurodeles waltl]